MISDDKKAYIRTMSSEELREKIATSVFGGENAAFAEMVLLEREQVAVAEHEQVTADAAIRSAAAAEASSRTARWALAVSALALVVAVAALFAR
jgi:hypothetical protein